MIKFSTWSVSGLEPAIRGMRNPRDSWERSDSKFPDGEGADPGCVIGSNDHELMMKLAAGGPVHAKYRRMIVVHADILAPLYWWKEFDTYKVGTVANSCSSMHRIHAKEFSMDDFSHEHLMAGDELQWGDTVPERVLESVVLALNEYRKKFIDTGDKRYWWQMIQLLPSSYNQLRTVMMNYEVLSNIYASRRNHKLDEWRDFCGWIEELPYSEIITLTQ